MTSKLGNPLDTMNATAPVIVDTSAVESLGYPGNNGKGARPNFRFDNNEEMRRGEFGLIGAEQGDETDYDKRFAGEAKETEDAAQHDDDIDEDGDGDDNGKSPIHRIKFSKQKLYGRDRELQLFQDYFSKLKPQQSNYNNKSRISQRNMNSNSNFMDNSRRSASGMTHPADIDLLDEGGPSQIVFLSGYSGSGKTRLVQEAVQRFYTSANVNHSNATFHPIYIQGKYEEMRGSTSETYKGISEAFQKWYSSLSEDNREVLSYIQMEMESKVGEDALLLAEIIPSLNTFLEEQGNNSESASVLSGSNRYHQRGGNRGRDDGSVIGGTKDAINKSRLHFVFHTFIQCLCTEESPLIMFLDDLQWADQDSLDLLLSVLSDGAGCQHLFFVGAYRSNEWHPNSPLGKFMTELRFHRGDDGVGSGSYDNDDGDKKDDDDHLDGTIHTMELLDLSKQNVNEFIGDTLNFTDPEEVRPLSEAIFSRTLGNMFFTMQALEQLVRKNALYYDMISFQWCWVLPPDQLESLLSNGVLEMVQSKIEHVPHKLQKILIMAAYTRSTLHVSILRELLNKERHLGLSSVATASTSANIKRSSFAGFEGGSETGMEWTVKELFEWLDRAVLEGLLVNREGTEEYSFAHDRIREAAATFVKGDDKDKLLVHIGSVLAERGSSPTLGEDWMLTTALHHWNSIPKSYHLELDPHNPKANKKKVSARLLQLAKLHLETARLASAKAAFGNAAKYAEQGIGWLTESGGVNSSFKSTGKGKIDKGNNAMDPTSKLWKKHGDLMKELHEIAAESLRLIGEIDKMEMYCTEFLEATKEESLDVKFQIYYTYANGIFYGSTGDRHEEAKGILLMLLKHLKCKFPKAGGVFGTLKTVFKLIGVSMTKSRRTEAEIESMEPMDDPDKMECMKLLDKTFEICYMTNDQALLPLVMFRSLDYTFRHGLSVYSPRIFGAFCILFTGALNDIQGGAIYGHYAIKLNEKVNYKPTFCGAATLVYLFGLHYSLPIAECIEPLRTAHSVGVKTGDLITAQWAIWISIVVAFQAGRPLRTLLEDYKQYVPIMEKSGNRLVSIYAIATWNQALALTGQSLQPLEWSKAEEENDVNRELSRGVQRLTWMHLGEYETCAEDAAAYARNLIKASPGAPIPVYDMFACALSSIIMLRKSGKSKYKKEFNRARGWLMDWEKQGNPNTRHWTALLDAEYAAWKKKNKVAVNKFALSVDWALEGGYIQDASLANERWGEFGLEVLQDEKFAAGRIKEAIRLSQQWGATEKTKRLREKYKM